MWMRRGMRFGRTSLLITKDGEQILVHPRDTLKSCRKSKKQFNARKYWRGDISSNTRISGTTSKAIMKNYGSLRELLNKMNEDQHCLDNIKYKTKTGQMRRINKTSVQSIYKFLLRDKKESDVIVVKD